MQNRDITTQRIPRQKASGAIPSEKRAEVRDEFFRNAIDPRQLLQPFEHLPGVLYFVKDAESRLMSVSQELFRRFGLENDEDVVGLRPHDYLPKDIADKFLADDRQVMQTGQPLLNVVEMWLNEQGVRDWIVTDKYPLRNAAGKVVGIVGTIQSFEARRKILAHLGPVGKAADYIRDHLRDGLQVRAIANEVGFSERQLQRLFRRVFGITIQQFIIQSRVHAAIHELTNSDRSIAEIAAMLGFSDQSAFSNTFRHVTGLPPRTYRQKYIAKFTQ